MGNIIDMEDWMKSNLNDKLKTKILHSSDQELRQIIFELVQFQTTFFNQFKSNLETQLEIGETIQLISEKHLESREVQNEIIETLSSFSESNKMIWQAINDLREVIYSE